MKSMKVTLVVVPRERFSYAQRSLESIYTNTEYPFELIYIDGNSPSHVQKYLQEQSKKRGFRLTRTEHYLSPNQARNIGLQQVNTEYLVFIDNDVLVQQGWLKALVDCGDRTGAAVVGPLCLEGEAFKTVHQTGGEIIFRDLKDGRKWLIEKRPFMHLPLVKCSEQLKPSPTQLVEFHTVMARRSIFDEIGLLDEQLPSMAEETDFCLSVSHAGGTVYFEPACVISYIPPFSLEKSDIPYFAQRWSDAWCKMSMRRMAQKYKLSGDAPILRTYLAFVRSHRQLAFGDLSMLKSVSYPCLPITDKIRYLFKKFAPTGLFKMAKRYYTNLNKQQAQQL